MADRFDSLVEAGGRLIRLCGVALLFLLLCACGEENTPSKASDPAAPAQEPLRGYSFTGETLSVDGLGEISLVAFRMHVVRKLATPWAKFRALSQHLASLLPSEPSRELQRRTRLLARSGRFDTLLPKPRGKWRSEAAELDLGLLLAQLWVLEHPVDLPPIELEALARLLDAAFLRYPVEMATDAGPVIARCGEQSVETMELFPDLLALMKPEQREALLEEAIRAQH